MVMASLWLWLWLGLALLATARGTSVPPTSIEGVVPGTWNPMPEPTQGKAICYNELDLRQALMNTTVVWAVVQNDITLTAAAWQNTVVTLQRNFTISGEGLVQCGPVFCLWGTLFPGP